MASRGCELGTRDTCRNCGQKIIYLIEESKTQSLYRQHYIWTHMLPGGEHKRDCDKRRIKDKTRRGWLGIHAMPASWCWEDMNHSAWHSTTCQRPVKDTERFMCGIHSAAEKKKERNEQERKEAGDLRQYMLEELTKVCKHLEDEFDLHCEPHGFHKGNDWYNSYDGRIRVDATELLRLLVEMRDEERF